MCGSARVNQCATCVETCGMQVHWAPPAACGAVLQRPDQVDGGRRRQRAQARHQPAVGVLHAHIRAGAGACRRSGLTVCGAGGRLGRSRRWPLLPLRAGRHDPHHPQVKGVVEGGVGGWVAGARAEWGFMFARRGCCPRSRPRANRPCSGQVSGINHLHMTGGSCLPV